MSVREAYGDWAATYDSDRNLTRDLDQVVTREMLAHLRPTSILELGCGTGKNTTFLAQLGEHVHALDFSEAMILQAKAKVQSERVTFTLADLTRPWPRADGSVDLIVCNLVLEHIANLSFIFAEAARVLVRPGLFLVAELHPFKQYQGAKAMFQRNDIQVEILAFVHHISDFLDAAADAGFTLSNLKEWWHEQDQHAPPRLVSFTFAK